MQDLQDIPMLDKIERYIRGEMLPEERVFFEQLRKTNAGVDQMVVEHTIFLNQLNTFGEQKAFKSTLHDIHNGLFETGAIRPPATGKVIQLWKKYKRVVTVAASIACITALAISGLVTYVSPKVSNEKLELLNRHIGNQDRQIRSQEIKLKDLSNKLNEVPHPPADAVAKVGGTGFLVDAKGYLVTNAHVVSHATAVTVQNLRGQEFKAKIIYIEPTSDLAFLKIEDEDFKPNATLPYAINKTSADLGEQIFTLGYPRDEIVYGEGYMSAKTGFEGIPWPADCRGRKPGEQWCTGIEQKREVIGVLSTRQIQAQGVVFAIRSKNIYKMLDEIKMIKGESAISSIRIPTVSAIKGLDRVQQIKKMEDCIFVVKSY